GWTPGRLRASLDRAKQRVSRVVREAVRKLHEGPFEYLELAGRALPLLRFFHGPTEVRSRFVRFRQLEARFFGFALELAAERIGRLPICRIEMACRSLFAKPRELVTQARLDRLFSRHRLQLLPELFDAARRRGIRRLRGGGRKANHHRDRQEAAAERD